MDKKITKTIGGILLVIGLILLFSGIRITSFSFGRMSWFGIVIICMLIDGVVLMVKPSKIAIIIMAFLILAIIVLVLTNLRMFMRPMSFFKMAGIIVLLASGIGLIIKGNMK